MNFSVVQFGIITFVMLCLAVFRPTAAVFLWPLAAIILHAARAVVGAPIYVADLATLILVWIVIRRAAGPALLIPRVRAWHRWFLAWVTISAAGASLRFGIAAEAGYELFRIALSFALFPAFAWLFGTARLDREQRALGLGTCVAVVVLLALEGYEFGNPSGAQRVKALLLGDVMRSSVFERIEMVSEAWASRPSGPFHGPTVAAGIGLLLGALGWLALRGNNKLAMVCVACGLGAAALTVSRHGAVAVLGALPFWLVGGGKGSSRFSTLKRGLALGVVAVGLTLAVGEAWTSRLESRGSMLRDQNISIRVVDGPLRYARAVADDPVLLLVGTGPGAHKARFIDDAQSLRHLGIASNSFLLPLLYLGLPGLFLYLAFWGEAAAAALRMRKVVGPEAIGIVVMAAIIVASDNYGYMSRPAMRLWIAIFGAMVGMSVRIGAGRSPGRESALAPPRPGSALADIRPAYVARFPPTESAPPKSSPA